MTAAVALAPALSDHALGVSASFTGRPWYFRACDERCARMLAQGGGVDAVLARIMAGRGVTIDGLERFLNPSLRHELPDPSCLAGMAAATERLARAVAAGETIAIFGDYDVDGATSAALLIRYLRALGREALLYVPDRQREGYGPNAPALAALRAQGADLVVTVDCGTLAFEALDHARELGLDVVVLDHHQAEAALPPAVAVVNPNRLDDRSGLGSLAAVGVTFMTLVSLNRALRAAGVFATRPEPDLMGLLDLVALGTVADVMALTGLNRVLVAQGLKVLAARRNRGLSALMDAARIDTAPGAYHLGFLLGPRVNAGGRVGQSDLGARLLSTEDPEEAAAIAGLLEGHNAERRRIEAEVEAAAVAAVEERLARGNGLGPVLVVAGEGWHQGVIGIVASRLKERYGRPAFVLSVDGGEAKGSGRSIPGVDLGAAVSAARAEGLIRHGGGHVMAAGLTAPADRLDDLEAFWSARLDAAVTAARARAGLEVDVPLSLMALGLETVERLAALAPFGIGNPEPRFILTAVTVAHAMPMGQGGHLRLTLCDDGGRRAEAVAFRSGAGALVEGLAAIAAARGRVHLAGHLRADHWGGRARARFIVDDAAAASM